MKKIYFIAPSGCIADTSAVDRAASYFGKLGWQVQVGQNVWHKHERFAGDDATRVKELHAAARSDADVVMAVRGGYGLTRLLDKINWALIKKSQKLWVGHSDFTAFQLALLARSRTVSYAGPMALYDFSGEQTSSFTEKYLWSALRKKTTTIRVRDREQPQCDVEGILWGGNLTVLCSLIGTRYLPKIQGGILFLEDVNEHPYRIERMLYQLQYAGILPKQSAVVFGDFSGYKLGVADNGYSFDMMVKHVRQRFHVPILTHLPFGHCVDKVTLPVGAKGTLQVSRGGYVLRF